MTSHPIKAKQPPCKAASWRSTRLSLRLQAMWWQLAWGMWPGPKGRSLHVELAGPVAHHALVQQETRTGPQNFLSESPALHVFGSHAHTTFGPEPGEGATVQAPSLAFARLQAPSVASGLFVSRWGPGCELPMMGLLKGRPLASTFGAEGQTLVKATCLAWDKPSRQ